MMNKRGTDRILAIYWFLVLTFVAGGVFAMVYVFYGNPYDVREIESEILTQRIADCISRQGTIDPDFFGEEGFNQEIGKTFTERCKLNFDVEEGYDDENTMQYFYKIEFYTVNNFATPSFSFKDGNSNWESECFIKKENDKEYTRLAKCTEKRFYAVGNGGSQYLIKILSIIGKSEKNVKQ